MSFIHGDRVEIKSGFHKDRRGEVFARMFWCYYAVIFRPSLDIAWFFPWNLKLVNREC